MRILVYPHDLNMGGSQMNAIELAAAVTALGHECIIFGRRGTLCERIEELGLEFVESPDPGRTPSMAVARAIRELIRERGIDIVHGYEWPPGMEGAWAVRGTSAAAVCTVMSMAVADFLPRALPLTVGTQQISAHEQAKGRERVILLEPPVDIAHNHEPSAIELRAFRERWSLDGSPLLVCVGRLATELKSEGLLTAIEVVGKIAQQHPMQFLIVGDGAARPAIERAAAAVNTATGTNTIVLTGQLDDPRAAYAVADISLAMGGSALRSLAYGKPLIVQGEQGFFVTVTPETVDLFRWQGWYGIGAGAELGPAALTAELLPLVRDPLLRDELGGFARHIVGEYSLAAAAGRVVGVYSDALQAKTEREIPWADWVRSARQFLSYFVRRRLARALGRHRADDFNAVPVAAQGLRTEPTHDAGRAGTGIVYFAGVRWDDVVGSDRQLVAELAKLTDVVWVDPIRSVLRHRRSPAVEVSEPAAGVTRVAVSGPPGASRPVLRAVAVRVHARAVQRFLRDHGTPMRAVVASTPAPILPRLRGLSAMKAYFATDDFVEAARLWGVSPRYLSAAREKNLAAADLVLAVTPELARQLQRGASMPKLFPNGADLERYARIDDVPVADGIALVHPRAGVVGQFNERTDVALLRSLPLAGIPLLLVGPASFRSERLRRDFHALTAMSGVQWVGGVPREQVASYLRAIDVGVTPYADTAFNRRSYPLKTVEYLAAGVPVVSSTAPPLEDFDPDFVVGAESGDALVAGVEHFFAERPRAEEVRRSVADKSWSHRAAALWEMLGGVISEER
ncbi:MAG: glycosyltransferase [Microbacteriaceae bacterium]|jgi:glycosyltransferase involved in cell wall biosynthesis|nr:glycosyltransferase [Microbacteriaceae bacterium]HQA22648.1 glycosyltransferase [Rhodoglobus sp.]HQE46135.1 glycosyltransferase [Rhodoglobus sp.]